MVVLWKIFVFFSPSLSHFILDFCLHNVSSCFSLSNICDSRIFSCFDKSSDQPSFMILYCRRFISWSRAFWAWKIFPKEVWFQCLILPLRFLSFYWNWNILVPSGGVKLFHSVLIKLLKSGWDIQKASNRNGLWMVFPKWVHWSEIGQWSDPEIGRMEAKKSLPKWMALSDNKNLSRWEETCCSPALFLFHVKSPLLKGMSISQLF